MAGRGYLMIGEVSDGHVWVAVQGLPHAGFRLEMTSAIGSDRWVAVDAKPEVLEEEGIQWWLIDPATEVQNSLFFRVSAAMLDRPRDDTDGPVLPGPAGLAGVARWLRCSLLTDHSGMLVARASPTSQFRARKLGVDSLIDP